MPLLAGSIGSDAQFYNWIDQVVGDVFPDNVCGNGVCEGPGEYAGIGRFGCFSDCGRYVQRTPILIEVMPSWQVNPPGIDLSGFTLSPDSNVQFTYNIFSETMDGYMFATDSSLNSTSFDVPDGNFRFELYQANLVSPDTPDIFISHYAAVAPRTMMKTNKSFDFQYADPAEVIATAANLNRQVHNYCVQNQATNQSSCGGGTYDPNSMADWFLKSYGLSGAVSIVNGAERVRLVSFPFCSMAAPQSVADSARVDSSKCGSANRASVCYDARILAQRFACVGSFSFSVWAYGPPRRVTVIPPQIFPPRTLTPFNNVIGSIIITQYRRKSADCATQNSPSLRPLTGKFLCQSEERSEAPFGVDPGFQPSSALYNGKLVLQDHYAANELLASNDANGILRTSKYPFGFFPHQWDRGGQKLQEHIWQSDVGLYKLFFDGRLSSVQARKLARYMRDAPFLSNKTEWIELEIITYNAVRCT